LLRNGIRIFDLLLVTFRRWSFCFPVTALIAIAVIEFSEPSLSFGRTLDIKRPWLAICAVVNVWYFLTMVVTFDVLPRVAFLTQHSIAVVVFEVADTLDRVVFLG
jgi:hypothetical protein